MALVEIRLATLNESGTISALMQEAFAEFRHLYTDGGFAATALKEDEIRDRIVEGPVWIAVRDGRILGTASAVVKGEGLYIRGVAALPGARGVGVGSALMSEAEKFAATKECKRLALTTTPFLSAAIRLYERIGFRRTEEPVDLFGTPLFAMEKEL